VSESKVVEGVVKVNPHGDWSDVDRGAYVDGELVANAAWSIFHDFKGQRVRVTIEVLPDEPTEDA
jgi:hypothetical protein